MDLGKIISDWLLQNSQSNGDCFEVFGTSGNLDVGGFESAVVEDGFLIIYHFRVILG